jgi:uncharacterized protein (DUF1800 family)
MQSSENRRLNDWSPEEAWQPWRPTTAEPWNLKWAGHLLRRAAFGYPALRDDEDSWSALQRAVSQGLNATLDELFRSPDSDFESLVDSSGQQIAAGNSADDLRGWWLYRMLQSPTPLRERMTLFWHNHFATSLNKVQEIKLMFVQNQTLRQHALGKFEPLLSAVSRDPAMIIWLDLQENRRGHVNENFGRELMELFTLGVGHYTESDVRNMARAFTGWQQSGGQARFDPERFDNGPKKIFGQSGNFDGAAAIRILLKQPAVAQRIVRKLFRGFIGEAESPSDALLAPLVDDFRKSNFDVGQTLRKMLSSRLFFSAAAYRRRIKSPVELVVGTARALGGNYPMQSLVDRLNGLGQNLFMPPNVKGWDGGKIWLNSATMLARDNMLWQMVGYPTAKTSDSADLYQYSDPVGMARSHAGGEPVKQIEFLTNLFLQEDIPRPVATRLDNYITKDAQTGMTPENRLRATLHMLLTLPEYQLA